MIDTPGNIMRGDSCGSIIVNWDTNIHGGMNENYIDMWEQKSERPDGPGR